MLEGKVIEVNAAVIIDKPSEMLAKIKGALFDNIVSFLATRKAAIF